MKSIIAFLALFLAMANAESCYSELANVCRSNAGRYADVKGIHFYQTYTYDHQTNFELI